MRIQHNIMAMNAYRNLGTNNSSLSKNLEKLSSGYRINRAGDDAAGLAISEKMRAQISGLDQAQSNVNDGISLVQTAEGAMQEIHDMLNRMVTLTTQASNGTYDATDVANIEEEVNALKNEIDRICESSNFNDIQLLDGTQASGGAGGAATPAAPDFTAITTPVTLGTDAGITVSSLKGGNIQTAAGANTGDIKIGYNATDKVFELKVGSTVIGKSAVNDIATTALTAATTISFTSTDGNATDLGSITITPGTATTSIDDSTFSTDIDTGADVAAAAPGAGATGGIVLQIGASADDKITINIDSMDSTALGLDALDISNTTNANTSINTVKDAINTVSAARAKLGAYQNRLEHTNNNLGVMEENIQNAEATIRDTDIAEEMMAYTKNNILIQSAQAMLAQANQVPQGVLQLMQ